MDKDLEQLQALKNKITEYRNAIATDKEVVLSSVALNLRIVKKSLIDKICDFIINEIQKDIEQEIKD